MKSFEFYGCQRDLSPELKRIVKNLSCQTHKFIYCPNCKQYDEVDYDPLENIQKFMKFIKEEQEKLDPKKKKVKKKKKNEEDSLSEITDIDKEEILAKYYHGKLTKLEQKKKDREATLKRLRGETVDVKRQHCCGNNAGRNFVLPG